MAGGIEVGTAYVTVLPSARGFGPALMKQVDPHLKQAGQQAGRTMGQGIARTAGQEVSTAARRGRLFNLPMFRKAGEDAGKAASSGLGRAFATQTSNAAKSLTQITYGLNGVVPALTGAAGAAGRFVSEAGAISPVVGGVVTAVGASVVALIAYEAAVGAVTVALAKWGVEEAANLELLTAQSAVLLGSKRNAQDYVGYVLQIAQESIVSTDALLRAGRTFAAFGVDNVNNVKALVGQLNNFAAAAGLGIEQVDNLALALAQIYSLGRLQGQEVRQLAQVGVSSIKVLQTIPKYAKMSAAQIKEAQEAGEISARDFFTAWETYTLKYQGAAKETSQTVIGLFQQIVDTAKIKLGSALKPALEPLKAFLRDIVTLVQSVNFEPIGYAIKSVFDSLRNALGMGQDALGLTNLKYFFEVSLPNAIYQFGVVASAILAQVRFFVSILIEPFSLLFGAFDSASAQGNALATVLQVVNGIALVVGGTFNGLAIAVRTLVTFVSSAVQAVIGMSNVVRAVLERDLDGIKNAISDANNAIITSWSDLAGDAYTTGRNVYNNFVSANSAANYAAAGAAAGSAWSIAFAQTLNTDESRRARARDWQATQVAKPPSLDIGSMPVPSIKTPKAAKASKAAKAKPSFSDSIDTSLGKTAFDIWKDAQQFLRAARIAGIKQASAVYKNLEQQSKKLVTYAKARMKVTDALEREQKVLDGLREKYDRLKDGIADSVTSFGNVQNALIPGINSSRGFLGRLRNLATQARAYTAALAKLKAAGASPALLEQVALAGVEEGTKIANTLLKGGAAGIGEANALVKDVQNVAKYASTTLANGMYGAGIAAAEGLVAGLEAKQSALTRAMEKLAYSMIVAVKKKLGIASPSKAFAQLAGYSVDGWVGGIEDNTPRAVAALNGLVSPTRIDGMDLKASDLGGDVYVFVGNEQLDSHIDYRVQRGSARGASYATTRRGR